MEAVLASDVEACVVGLGSNWTLDFRSGTPTNYKEAVHGLDHPRAQAYWSAMLDQGILEPPFPLEIDDCASQPRRRTST